MGFPDGWTFWCTTTSNESFNPPGCRLRSPSGLVFRSIDSAIARHKRTLATLPNLKKDFYEHLGLPFPMEPSVEFRRTQSYSSPAPKKRRTFRELTSTKEVGSRVYCKWRNGDPHDGSYYWGTIVKKFKVGSYYHYAIQFEDGDYLDDLSDDETLEERNIYTEALFKQIIGKMPPPPPADSPPMPASSDLPMTPLELFVGRCRSCVACSRRDCKRCASCETNKDLVATLPKDVCLQNVSIYYGSLNSRNLSFLY